MTPDDDNNTIINPEPIVIPPVEEKPPIEEQPIIENKPIIESKPIPPFIVGQPRPMNPDQLSVGRVLPQNVNTMFTKSGMSLPIQATSIGIYRGTSANAPTTGNTFLMGEKKGLGFAVADSSAMEKNTAIEPLKITITPATIYAKKFAIATGGTFIPSEFAGQKQGVLMPDGSFFGEWDLYRARR
jgi:hypothetical protein